MEYEEKTAVSEESVCEDISYEQTEMPRPKYPCGVCDKAVQSGIQCNGCKRWHHNDCPGVGINDSEIQLFSKCKKFKWFCRICDKDVTEILTHFEKFKKFSSLIENQKNEIKATKEALDTKINQVLTRLNNLEKDGPKLNKKIEEKITEITASNPSKIDIEEQKQIEMRKKNIIFFGLPEPQNENLEGKLEEEYAYLSEALQTGEYDLERDEITDMFRLGKISEEGDAKPRPLLVKFRDEVTKQDVLTSTGKCSIRNNNEVIRIFASTDMTKKQREEHKKLRSTLKARKDAGEDNLIIRNGKIVNSQFFHAQRAVKSRVIWARSVSMHQQSAAAEQNHQTD